MTSSSSSDRHREIGDTHISRAAARVFAVLTLGALFLVSAVEWRTALPAASAGWTGAGEARGAWAMNQALRRSMQAFEDRLREEAWLTRRVTPPFQAFKVARLRLGTESVLIGRDGWLHFAPDVDYLTMPSRRMQLARAASAIDDFAAQLAARNIRLGLVPTPVKTAFVPDTLHPRLEGAPIERAEIAGWLAEREKAGVIVLNPAEVWRQEAAAARRYLRGDTHWTFEAMDRVARALAERLRASISDLPPPAVRYEEDAEFTADIGDLARMLGRGLPSGLRNPEPQTIRRVREGDFAWRPTAGSPVLLLGDSFSNIYSQEALGWGGGAGLAERMSFYLGFPVDRIVRNDEGARASRELLARELALGRDRLAGVRVVVWQFAMRELARGDWIRVELALGKKRSRVFAAPPPRPSIWTGRVAAVSATPAPGRVPYADHIAAIHVTDLAGADVWADEAYVLTWSMTNHQRAAGARLRPGDRFRFRAIDWEAVADRLEGINRSELDGDEFWSADPIWAEVLP
jgi:alginate O-acetyltransferase complex protein AlgJ